MNLRNVKIHSLPVMINGEHPVNAERSPMKKSRESQIAAGCRRLAAPCAITLLLTLVLWPGLTFAQANGSTLLTTITNPAPADSYRFGYPMATVRSDRVLIGDSSGNKAYLFSTGGTLLTNFTDPNPAFGSAFGYSLAAMGSDQVLIGAAFGVGAVYRFSTDGTLLATITNPAPITYNGFGASLAAVGSDRVLIGAIDFAGLGDGRAYLFSTNGTLITTFTNPTPANFDQFGSSVAALGNDRVLIGELADGGVPGNAYLFSTNGTLLTTFHNPTPAASDFFGFPVAALGNDRVLIGAFGDDTGAGGAGSAYLFSTNGTMLITFTNPTPAALELFGIRVTAVGNNRVLIGAPYDDSGAESAGVAYVFSTNGTLLTTFTNPTPAVDGGFSLYLAAVGNDQVLIGAPGNSSGGVDVAGEVYLFAIPYPSLSIARNAATVSLKWVTPETGLALQQASVLGTPTVWSNSTNSVFINGLSNVVQQTLVSTNRFFRLHRP